MAHWPGKAEFDDGKIMFLEYSATVDVCYPKLFESEEELDTNWRQQKPDSDDIKCEHSEEDVIITTPFDRWKGRACRRCNNLTDNLRLPED